MKAIMRSLAYNLAEGGVSQIGRKVIERVRSWVASEEMWLIYRVSLYECPESLSAPLERRSLSFADLQTWGYFKALAFPEGIKARLDSGATCHGFFVEGDLVHLKWSTDEFLEIVSGLVVAAPGGIGSYDSHTIPRHRRKGYQSAALLTLRSYLSAQGKTHMLTAVEVGHFISIKGIEKGGGHLAGTVTRRVRLGKVTIHLDGDGLALHDH